MIDHQTAKPTDTKQINSVFLIPRYLCDEELSDWEDSDDCFHVCALFNKWSPLKTPKNQLEMLDSYKNRDIHSKTGANVAKRSLFR